MIDPSVGIAVTLVTLLGFAWVGIRGAARFGVGARDPYLSARGSQRTAPIALSFFASALGAWILFAPPEVGALRVAPEDPPLFGVVGIAGYAFGQALAVWVFAWLGPAVRARIPVGTTILDFVAARFGRVMQTYAGIISVGYMFFFLTAELTAIGGVLSLVAGTGRLVPVVAVAGVTAAYTAYGGLPASLHTDRWQAWLIMALVTVGALSVAGNVDRPVQAAVDGGFGDVSRAGIEVAVVLVIAIVAANLFHQGFWQRVWAARDDRVLVRGALAGGALIVPLVFAMGLAGMLAAGRGPVDDPSLAFFSLLDGLPGWVLAVVVALAVALVASTSDTLQNALTSLAAVHVAGGRLDLSAARIATIALTIPAAVIALQGHSVLRLFLIADLFAATIVFPVFLGLWERTTRAAALAGSVAGVLAVAGLGWVTRGSVPEGIALLTLPEGPALGAFVIAPLASGLVTVAVALASGPRTPTTRAAAGVR